MHAGFSRCPLISSQKGTPVGPPHEEQGERCSLYRLLAVRSVSSSRERQTRDGRAMSSIVSGGGGGGPMRRTRPRRKMGGMSDVRAVLSRDITVNVYREGAPEVRSEIKQTVQLRAAQASWAEFVSKVSAKDRHSTPTTYRSPPTTYHIPHATYHLPHTTYHLPLNT